MGALDSINLWQLFVNQIFGGFWLSVVGIALLIFLIMAVFGRMSKITVLYYLALFGMVMSIGYGYRFIAVIIGTALLGWVYIKYKDFIG